MLRSDNQGRIAVIRPSAQPRILVACATRHGSTEEVAKAIAAELRTAGCECNLLPAGEVRALDAYDAVVLGGAIYLGRWHRDAVRFLERHRRALSAVSLAVFALGPRTLESADVASSREQLDAALARLPDVHPELVAIFGGVVDPAKLRFPLNRMSASDARDWQAIRAWAAEVAALTPRVLV
jgi:menaquinone-dependent protoporphyrinogen oxidase